MELNKYIFHHYGMFFFEIVFFKIPQNEMYENII